MILLVLGRHPVFLQQKGPNFSELANTHWLYKLGFLTDISLEVNRLLKRSQGIGLLFTSLFGKCAFPAICRIFLERSAKSRSEKLSCFSLIPRDRRKPRYYGAVAPSLIKDVELNILSFQSRFQYVEPCLKASCFIMHPLEASGSMPQLTWLGIDDFERELVTLQDRRTRRAKFVHLENSLQSLEERKKQIFYRVSSGACLQSNPQQSISSVTSRRLPSSILAHERAAMALTVSF